MLEYERVLSLQERSARLTYSEFILSFEIDDVLYVHLEDFIIALGFNLEVENNSFRFQWEDKGQDIEINLNECFLRQNREIFSFNCQKSIEHFGEKYLRLEILNKALESEVEYFPRRSQLMISSDVDFPKLKIDRLKRNVLTAPSRRSFQPDRTHRPDYSWLDGFSYYQEVNMNYRKRSGSDLGSFDHYGSLDAEFAKMQLRVNNAGDERSFRNQWVSLSRQDEKSELLGPFGASEFTLGNFFAPPARHIPSLGKLRGVNLHNRALHQYTLSRFKNFEGEIKPGWIVELYRNNILIERQSPGDENRYRFDQVELNYGMNQFVFVFYGPSGEEERRERTLYLDRSALSGKAVTYDISIAENEDGEASYILHSEAPIGTTFLFSLAHLHSGDLDVTQSELSANLFNSSFIFSSARDNQGYVYGGELLRRISRLSLSGEYFIYDDFTGGNRRNQGLESRMRGNLSFPFFPRTQHILTLSREEKETHNRNFFRYRMSHNIGRFFINNQLERDDERTVLNSLLRLRINRWQLYSEGQYDRDQGLNSLTLGTRYRRGREASFSTALSRYFDSDTDSLTMSAQRYFSNFMTRLSFETSFKGESRIFLGLASSLFANPKNSYYSTRSRRSREVGDLLVRVYLPKTLSTPDGGTVVEKVGVENVCLNSLSSRERLCSDAQGFIRFEDLQTSNPVQLRLDFSDVFNFYLNSNDRNFKVYIRPGITTELSIPLVVYGEIEGFIYGLRADERRGNRYHINVEGLDLDFEARLRTDQDGYFYLSEVPPGHYKAILFENNEVYEEHEFFMPEEGDLISIDFDLE